ncbi:MAG: DUF2807 domain-containing protein [Bacteroidales bacterium]|nr:DUF2807 domain-containing protein [Bacteroidales bacterium]
MKKHLIILSTLILFAFSGCQKFAGDPISKDFSITGTYTELEVEDAFDVTVSDVATQITVTAGENVMPNVVVETVENTLKIYLKGWHNNLGKDMTVILPYNADLTSVDLSGASEFHSEYGLEGNKVDVELSGASEFYCEIDADEVDIDLSGASSFFGDIWADEIEMDLTGASKIKGYAEALDLDLEMSGASEATFEGQVDMLKINLTGASDIKKTINGNRYGFTCDQCEGTMSGASNVYIHCDGTIKVNLSGASNLHFTGSAFTGDCTTSGGSNVSHDTL